MTPAQLDHLKRLDAHLDAMLALAAKRTPGTWQAGKPTWNKRGRPFRAPITASKTVCNTYDAGRKHEHCILTNTSPDAAFIAACAGRAEAGWRATKAVIASLQYRHAYSGVAREALQDILAAWPLELLTLP